MKHSIPVTAIMIVLFFSSQIVGLKIIDNYIDKEATSETGVTTYKSLPYSIERPDIAPEQSIWFIVIAILLGTGILLLLVKFRRIGIWKIWFLLSVVLTLSIALSSFIPSAIAFISAIAFGIWKVFKPNVFVHNLTEVFIYGGLAAIFVPILNVAAVFILLIVISAYDMFAVWQSKHMVSMAKFQTESNLFSGLYIPKNRIAQPVQSAGKGIKSRVTSAVLGGGDMGFPLIFAGVSMKSIGFPAILAIPVCATIALLVLLILAQKNKFYPAMPFLSTGCFVGYGIAAFLF